MINKIPISGALILLICAPSYASDTKTEVIAEADSIWASSVELKEVGVTGKKAINARKDLSQTPVYDRNIMASAPVQNIESVLKLSPAVDTRERGGKGVQTDFNIRGGSFDQTMVSLNGINFTDARTGHQSHSLPIDINIVSDISVVDGVSGVGAYAGAVDIHTAPNRPKYLSAELTGGMHQYFYTNLSGNYSTDNLSILGMGSVRHSGGYIHNTDFTNYNAYANIRYSSPQIGIFEAQAGYQHRAFGANGFYSRKFPDQYETTSTALGSIRWQMTRRRLTLTANASYRYNTDCFELIKGDESLVPFNHHITDNIGAEAGAAYDWGQSGETSINVDYTFNHILSTVLGEKCTPKDIRDIKYDHKKTRSTINAVLRHSITLNTLTLSAAGGLSHSDYGTDGLWSAGASYAIDSYWRVGAGAVESMRLPTFTDLYYTATGYVSDRNLVPEHATTVNISSSFNHGPWGASVYTYYRHGRNVIDWVKPEGEDNWHSMQVTRINTYGAELTASYVTSSRLRRIALSYGHIHQTSKVDPNMVSSIAFDHLRNKLGAMIDVNPIQRLTLSITGTLFDRIGNYTDRTGTVCPYKPFFLMDVRATYQHSWWQIYADCTNITGTRYFDYGGLEMPGAWVSGGLIITL